MVAHFTFNERAYFTWCCWLLIEEFDGDDTVEHDDQLSDCPGMQLRAEEERREHEKAASSGNWGGWGTEEQWLKVRRHVRSIVAEAPPLSEHQRSVLSGLLGPIAGPASPQPARPGRRRIHRRNSRIGKE